MQGNGHALLLLILPLLSLSCQSQRADRSLLRGLIALRKQFIPYTSAVERRLNEEYPIPPQVHNADYTSYLSTSQQQTLPQGYDNHPFVSQTPDATNAVFISYYEPTDPSTNVNNGPPTSELYGTKIFHRYFPSDNEYSSSIHRGKVSGRRIQDGVPFVDNRISYKERRDHFSKNTWKDVQEKDALGKREQVSTQNSTDAQVEYSSSYSKIKFPAGASETFRNQTALLLGFPNDKSAVPHSDQQQQFTILPQSVSYLNVTFAVPSNNRINNKNTVGPMQIAHLGNHFRFTERPFRHRNPERPFRRRVTERPNRVSSESGGILETFISRLRNLPVVGNMLRATVDPVYRPLINTFLPMAAENRQSSEGFKEEVNCIENLGCIVTTIDFYDPIFRPINLPPDTRRSINTHYTLYTRKHSQGIHITPKNINKLKQSTYNPSLHTKFVIHGFLDDQNSTWIKDMVRGLLFHDDCNVFVVDWSSGSRVIYPQAVSNIRVVALEIAALINWMNKEMGQLPEMVHVIGHSLGSHTAGYVGELVPGLGRITGLDPAEPFFQYMPPAVRLDPSDAKFVDVIHTDTDSIITLAWRLAGYGLEQPIGHIDFYPNGGRNQPGCSSLARIPLTVLQDGSGIAEGLDAAEKEAVACNHVRANKLFTASLFGTCSFIAFPCSSYEDFEKAECFKCGGEEGCAQLGINADQWQHKGRHHVKMFLSTSQGPNFCQYHYRLTLTMADESGAGGSLRGRLKITLITQNGELKEFDLSEEKGPLVFNRGSTRTFLLRHTEDLSSSREALLHWQYEADVFNPLTFCMIFCSTDLEVAALTLTPLDTPGTAQSATAAKGDTKPPEGVIMCQRMGEPFVKLESDTSIKISAEPFCKEIRDKQMKSGSEVKQEVEQEVEREEEQMVEEEVETGLKETTPTVN